MVQDVDIKQEEGRKSPKENKIEAAQNLLDTTFLACAMLHLFLVGRLTAAYLSRVKLVVR